MIRPGGTVSSILVTCRSKPAALNHYVPALRLAGWTGGVVVAAPGDSLPILELFGGLLLTGGQDIHPAAWDPQEPVHPTAEPDPERDGVELHAIREAWRLGIPILGICRGEQALNVALGGSLHQDIPSHFACPVDRHRHGSSELPPEVRHDVRLAPDSRLCALLGVPQVPVNSRHHQAVRAVAPPLRAVGWHDETQAEGEPLIEAVEARDAQRWAIGVQWHPENLVTLDHPEASEAARRLFSGFVAAVRG